MLFHAADDLAKADPPLRVEEMSSLQHVVGWTPCAQVSAGTTKSQYNVGVSTSERAKAPSCVQAGATLSAGKFVTGGLAFAQGRKESPKYFANDPYEVQIEHAGNLHVVLYDTDARIAWLLDGATVLLHLARTWLSSKYARNAVDNPVSVFKYGEGSSGYETSSQVLLRQENRDIPLFFAKSKERSIDDGQQSSEPTKGTVYTWENVVSDRWLLLEEICSHVKKTRDNPAGIAMRMPSTDRMEGHDFVDLVAAEGVIESRFVHLRSSEWLDMTRQCGALPILARNLGNLIVPAAPREPGPVRCARHMFVPTGHDLLVAHNRVLKELSRGTFSQGTFRLFDSDRWIRIDHGKACSCQSSRAKKCDCLVTLLMDFKDAEKTRKTVCELPESAELGASVFGRMPRLLTKKPPDGTTSSSSKRPRTAH